MWLLWAWWHLQVMQIAWASVSNGDAFPDMRVNVAPLKDHVRERMSVLRRPGGTCTPLHGFTRAFDAVLGNIWRRSRVAEKEGEEDAFNTTLGTDGSVIGALVKYDTEDADLFTVAFIQGARCEAPLT